MYVNEPLGKLNNDRDVSPLFLDILQKNYMRKLGEITDLDFRNDPQGSQDFINGKVSEATNGMIPDLVSGLDSNTLSVIVSAIFYEKPWADELKFRKLSEKESTDYRCQVRKFIEVVYNRFPALNLFRSCSKPVLLCS